MEFVWREEPNSSILRMKNDDNDDDTFPIDRRHCAIQSMFWTPNNFQQHFTKKKKQRQKKMPMIAFDAFCMRNQFSHSVDMKCWCVIFIIPLIFLIGLEFFLFAHKMRLRSSIFKCIASNWKYFMQKSSHRNGMEKQKFHKPDSMCDEIQNMQKKYKVWMWSQAYADYMVSVCVCLLIMRLDFIFLVVIFHLPKWILSRLLLCTPRWFADFKIIRCCLFFTFLN